MNSSRKAIPLRLPADVDAQLRAVAEVEGKSINATCQAAIEESIDRWRKDENFQIRLKNALARNRKALRLLAK